MVDYAPVLDRAVAALDPNTVETRHALYDRARRALIDGIRGNDPLSDADLRTQGAALEAAIEHVEAEALRRLRPSPPSQPQPQPALEADAPPVETYPDQPALRERRRPWGLIAGVIGALVLLLAGIAAYTLWPRRPGVPRPVVAARQAPQQQQVANTGYVYLRQPVYYRTNHAVGTIVVDKSQNFLYVVRPSVSALRYGIGVGPDCFTLAGLYPIVRKEEWPGWKAPSQPSVAAASEQIKNPLGARGLYLSKDYLIHGTNAPSTIGQRASQGCIRLTNDDIVHLYDRSPLETRVVVLN